MSPWIRLSEKVVSITFSGMQISITSLKLKSLFGFFRLSWNGLKISQQAKSQIGFLKMKNTGFGYLHFTITAWEAEKDLKAFAHSGAHFQAMKIGGKLAREITIYTYPAEKFPTWKEAKKLLADNGKVISYR